MKYSVQPEAPFHLPFFPPQRQDISMPSRGFSLREAGSKHRVSREETPAKRKGLWMIRLDCPNVDKELSEKATVILGDCVCMTS